MGNSLGGRRRAKVMMIDGSTIKVKAPAAAKDILRNHPGHVLLESEQVKQLGLRAKPLNPDQPLKPKKLYFLIELPKIPSPAIDHRSPQLGARRIRSGINMSAKDRLESLMLSRRTVSDITFSRAPPDSTGEGEGAGDGTLRVRLRLPKSQVARLVEESRDPAEAAEKIMDLCVGRSGDGAATRGAAAAGHVGTGAAAAVAGREAPAPGRAVNGATPVKEKRMRFALTEDEIIN